MKIDKRLLFNRIKLAIGVKTDADLAKFLEITPQTLANYIIRNSVDWDNLLSKCEFINVDFLLTGTGEMLRNNQKNGDVNNSSVVGASINGTSSELIEIIKKQQDQIGELIGIINKYGK